MPARQLAFGAALLAACAAPAADIVGSEDEPKQAEPSRSFTLEFKLGPYRPLVHRDPGLTGDPYKTIFGNSPMLLFEFEFDWIFWQKFGTLGVGGSIGYASKSAYALIAPGSPDAGSPSSERTSFRVIPLQAMLIYRLDYAALHSWIPLVPYGKAGLVFEPWWSTKGGGVEYFDGNRAVGAKRGYSFTGGISLMLDFLEPRMAKDFTTDLGVAHSYLFAEYTYANVNNFGSKGLDLSSRHWMFGFSMDFY